VAPVGAHEVFTALRCPDPHPEYRHWRTHPAQRLDSGEWLISGYASAAFALRCPDLVSTAPRDRDGAADSALRRPGSSVLLFTEPPEHTALRRCLASGLSPATNRFRSVFGDGLVSLGAEPGDLIRDVLVPALSEAVCCSLGIPADHAARHHRWARDASAALDPDADSDLVALASASGLRAMVDVTRTLRGRPEGLLGHLRAAIDAGELDENEAVANVVSLVAASLDTTHGLISSCLLRLDGEPALVGELRRSADQRGRFVEEVARLDAPVQLVSRRARRETEVPFGTIAAGTQLLVLLGSANRDETVFAEPDRLVLTDRPAHLGFGSGLHRCLGAAIARAYAAAAIELVLGVWDTFTVEADHVRPRAHPVFRAADAIPTHPATR
jgi:cytochrome P450